MCRPSGDGSGATGYCGASTLSILPSRQERATTRPSDFRQNSRLLPSRFQPSQRSPAGNSQRKKRPVRSAVTSVGPCFIARREELGDQRRCCGREPLSVTTVKGVEPPLLSSRTDQVLPAFK